MDTEKIWKDCALCSGTYRADQWREHLVIWHDKVAADER